MLDLILGLERTDGHSLGYYKTFKPNMQSELARFAQKGRALLVSGAFVGSDMTEQREQLFLKNVLKCRFAGVSSQYNGETINGMGTSFDIYRLLNEKHYAAVSTDILQPVAPAYTALKYADGEDACVAYKGKDYRSITIGFPFECIKEPQKRAAIMKGLLNYLLK